MYGWISGWILVGFLVGLWSLVGFWLVPGCDWFLVGSSLLLSGCFLVGVWLASGRELFLVGS